MDDNLENKKYNKEDMDNLYNKLDNDLEKLNNI